MELQVKNIVKSFGDKTVLKDVSFRAEVGSAFGLLGRNGAGKTTAIRIIMGVFPPDSGHVLVNGKKVSESGIKFGYLPEERGLYPKQKIFDQMTYIGQLRGLSAATAKKNSDFWLERLGMEEHKNSILSTLSKGNQQKIQLAVTMVSDPDIIILDEPFSGLDPVNAQMLKDVVSEQVKEGKIVIFSSHQMGYVEEFCDEIAILEQGHIVLEGNLKQIKRGYPRLDIEIELEGGNSAKRLQAILADKKDKLYTNITQNGDAAVVRLSEQAKKGELLTVLMSSDLVPEKFLVVEPNLEQIFVESVGDYNE